MRSEEHTSGVDLEPAPPPDLLRRLGRVRAGLEADEHGIDVGVHALGREDGVQNARRARPVERRILLRPPPLPEDRVVVLQELSLLGVLQWDEHHGVPARRDHAPRQADHFIGVPPYPDLVADPKARGRVRHRLVVVPGDLPPRREVCGLPRREDVALGDAHDHGPDVLLPPQHLGGEVRDVGRPRHARHGRHAPVDVVVDARRLGIGADGVLLDDPQVRPAAVEEDHGVIRHPPVDAAHGQGDADEKAEPHPREDELAPPVENVPPGQIDHPSAPPTRSTTFTRDRPVSAFSLYTTTLSPSATPSRIWTKPSGSLRPMTTG